MRGKKEYDAGQGITRNFDQIWTAKHTLRDSIGQVPKIGEGIAQGNVVKEPSKFLSTSAYVRFQSSLVINLFPIPLTPLMKI